MRLALLPLPAASAGRAMSCGRRRPGCLGAGSAGSRGQQGERQERLGPPPAEPRIGQPSGPVAAQPGLPPLPVLGGDQPLHLIAAGVAGLRRRERHAAVTMPVLVRRGLPARCGTGLAVISCCPAAHAKKPFTSASSRFHVEAATRGPAGSSRRQ